MKLNHITFRVKNLEKSVKFYEDLADLKVLKELEEGKARLAYLGTGNEENAMVELLEIKGGESFAGSGFFICFSCDVLDEKHQWAIKQELSPSPIMNPEDGTRYFYVYDPDGVSVQLREF